MGTCHLCGHHRWRPSRVMPTVKEIACCMWCGHWPTSNVDPIHGTAYLAWGIMVTLLRAQSIRGCTADSCEARYRFLRAPAGIGQHLDPRELRP